MSNSGNTPSPSSRRHDLDALRATAMLLGIVLHASLSFFPAPWWAVQDSHQNEVFGLLHEAIHGFRMPLFFLISGFFTMMLYRKRGLKSLLANRALRILVPCLIGVVTIVPVLRVTYVIASLSGASVLRIDKSSLAGAIRAGDTDRVREAIAKKEDLNRPDNVLSVTPLHWAMLMGNAEAFNLLVDAGADVNKPNADGSSPLHTAAFIGRDDFATRLLDKGADPNAKNLSGETALASTKVPVDSTIGLLQFLQLPIPDVAMLEAGRKLVRERLEPLAVVAASDSHESSKDARAIYRSLIASDHLAFGPKQFRFHLMETNVFDHLWFLWLLCWLVMGFALCVTLGSHVRLPFALPVVSEFRYLWLVPLSMIPQWFMGIHGSHVGPDTSLGVLPLPHVLAYYAVFFTFGALYHDVSDDAMRVARGWWLLLPLGLGVLLPVTLVTYENHLVNTLVQVLYAWCMSFGLMGLFHAISREESRTMRYMSDASYWMYLVHLPVIVVLQVVIRDWDMDPFLKFTLVNVVAILLLVASYQILVRHTLIGVLLNGRRGSGAGPAPQIQPPKQPAWGTATME